MSNSYHSSTRTLNSSPSHPTVSRHEGRSNNRMPYDRVTVSDSGHNKKKIDTDQSRYNSYDILPSSVGSALPTNQSQALTFSTITTPSPTTNRVIRVTICSINKPTYQLPVLILSSVDTLLKKILYTDEWIRLLNIQNPRFMYRDIDLRENRGESVIDIGMDNDSVVTIVAPS